MGIKIQGYIVGSIRETDRVENIRQLRSQLPLLELEEAIYPAYTHVPFKKQLLDLSYARTGHRLREGELGCLLSHRQVWRKIVNSHANANTLFLVLESDSYIQDLNVLENNYQDMSGRYDLFFWGAWEGHMQLFRSTRRPLGSGYDVGTPFIKTVYCTYGYSLNKKAAAYLLKQTGKISHPVDQFKYFITDETISIGGVMPELISTNGKETSYIRSPRNQFKERIFLSLLDLRNRIYCYFK